VLSSVDRVIFILRCFLIFIIIFDEHSIVFVFKHGQVLQLNRERSICAPFAAATALTLENWRAALSSIRWKKRGEVGGRSVCAPSLTRI